MARRGLVCLAALAVALITAPPLVARPTLDDGRTGPGARWDPGMLLVKLRPGIEPSHRRRMLRRLGLRAVDRLPVVPDLFEVRVPRGTHVRTAERKLRRRAEVLYTQPDYNKAPTPAAGPSDASYWPNDPFFWPSTFTPPKGCEDTVLGQWPLWQLGHNLTDSLNPAHRLFPPRPESAALPGGLVQYEQYHSINVLPVWNVLRSQRPARPSGPTGDDGHWGTRDIQRSGIAVQDSGLSNAPDIAPQIAALFSTVTSIEPTTIDGDSEGKPEPKDRVRLVYSDDPARGLVDIETVRKALKTRGIDYDEPKGRQIDFGFTDRPLFPLDDRGDRTMLFPSKGTNPQPPTGCDGHGTGVASVAAAKAGNGIGIAGVAYNVPLIGLRAGEYWDLDRSKASAALRNDIRTARNQSEEWWNESIKYQKVEYKNAEYTVENQIEQFQIVKALQVPVLNMSYRQSLATAAGPPPVVAEPARTEALLRTLATGETLGVASAGNDKEQYGSSTGSPFATRGEQVPTAPCGLKLLDKSDAIVPGGRTFRAAAFPGRSGGVGWDDVNLLCVAASNQYGSRLAAFSGSGDAAVDLAAPGEDITTLARPVVPGGLASEAYRVASGTSFAAPMVAGAAALLREAAPYAPIAEIKRALERGARKNGSLDGLVRAGSLDVACALRQLRKRQQSAPTYWGLVNFAEQDYPDFADATEDCGGKPRYVEETPQLVDANDLRAKGKTTLRALIDSSKLSTERTSVSLRWQERLLGKQGERVAFDSLGREADPSNLKDSVYDAGRASVGCTQPGFALTRLAAVVVGKGAPEVWYFPTDGQRQRDDGEPPRDQIEVSLALAKPLPKEPRSLTIRLWAYCDHFPSIG